MLQQYRIYCHKNSVMNAVVCNSCKDKELPPSITQHIKSLESLGINLSEIRITTETGAKKILAKISDEKMKKESILLASLRQK